MDYQYDVFISYRRQALTRQWINNLFIPALENHLYYELNRDPKFYIDEMLEAGTSWPISLGAALGSSRTIVPMWSQNYLNSVWCTCEISHMLERELKTGYRTIEKPDGLVFPTIINDGETLPVTLASIQTVEIQDCFNIYMSRDSPKAEKLADKLKPLGKALASAIKNAPAWTNDWKIESVNAFFQQFHNAAPIQQNEVPKFTQQ